LRKAKTVLAGSESSSSGVVWNRYGVCLQSCGSGKKVKPRVSGEKRAEDVLPSWRSMQSLAVKETALGLRSGSLASKRRNLDMMVSLKSVGVKENRTTLLCKKNATMRKSARLKIRCGAVTETPLWRWPGETPGRKERESSRKNPRANPASWGARQDHPPLSSLKSLCKTLATRGDATKNRLRDLRRDLERPYTHRQPRRNTVYPHAWGIHRRFIVPSQAIVIFRGIGDVFGTKSWQPRGKQNVQRSKKQIHLALRFRIRGLGLRTAELTA